MGLLIAPFVVPFCLLFSLVCLTLHLRMYKKKKKKWNLHNIFLSFLILCLYGLSFSNLSSSKSKELFDISLYLMAVATLLTFLSLLAHLFNIKRFYKNISIEDQRISTKNEVISLFPIGWAVLALGFIKLTSLEYLMNMDIFQFIFGQILTYLGIIIISICIYGLTKNLLLSVFLSITQTSLVFLIILQSIIKGFSLWILFIVFILVCINMITLIPNQKKYFQNHLNSQSLFEKYDRFISWLKTQKPHPKGQNSSLNRKFVIERRHGIFLVLSFATIGSAIYFSEITNFTRKIINFEGLRKKPKDGTPDGAQLGKKVPSNNVCTICGYIYDPQHGDPSNGIQAMTKWEHISEAWECPICGASKDDFVETTYTNQRSLSSSETNDVQSETELVRYYPVVDIKKCKATEECIDVCPVDVFEMLDGKACPTNAGDCLGCDSCTEVCENNAISITFLRI